MKGAGGTSGGIGHFFIGLIMLCGGAYMLLNVITVSSGFGLRMSLYHVNYMGGFSITSGMVLIPFMLGVGMIFFSAKNPLGWLLAIGSISAMVFGVISSLHFYIRPMSSFDLIVILVLTVGGLGLFLKSLW